METKSARVRPVPHCGHHALLCVCLSPKDRDCEVEGFPFRGGDCWSFPAHAHHVSEGAHPNTPLGDLSPASALPGTGRARPSEGTGDQAGWSDRQRPLGLVRLQEGWSLASAVATWAPSAGKVRASSLGVTSAASVPLSYGKASRGGGSPVLRHREEKLVTVSLRFSRVVTGRGFFWSQLRC